jgi:hypothetical protein
MNLLESINYFFHKIYSLFCCCSICKEEEIIYGGGFKDKKVGKLIRNIKVDNKRFNYT